MAKGVPVSKAIKEMAKEAEAEVEDKKPNCEACQFWYMVGDPQEPLNECRRYAPCGSGQARWPITKGRDFCFDFISK